MAKQKTAFNVMFHFSIMKAIFISATFLLAAAKLMFFAFYMDHVFLPGV